MTTELFSDSARKHNAQHQAVDSLVSQQKRPTATGLEREGARSIAELPPRFQSKISVAPSGCWLWTGYIDRAGYGQVRHKGKLSTPHRAVFEILCGTVTAEDVDHLCRVRHCVNPAHLEPVTHRENMRRGNAPAGLNARKTHCKRGHEFTPENTIPHGKGNRNCLACRKTRNAAAYLSRRVEVAS